MKKVYLVDSDCDSGLGESIVRLVNDDVGFIQFATRKSAMEHLVKSFREMKQKYTDKIAELKKYCKKNDDYEVITIDCWVGEVEDDFDINKDSFWEYAIENHKLLACRYLCGRY